MLFQIQSQLPIISDFWKWLLLVCDTCTVIRLLMFIIIQVFLLYIYNYYNFVLFYDFNFLLISMVHRDVAARNCLVDGHGAVKISDFGLSILVAHVDLEVDMAQCMPIRYYTQIHVSTIISLLIFPKQANLRN